MSETDAAEKDRQNAAAVRAQAHDASDLEAQWMAARAAKAQADFTWPNAILGVISALGVLSALALSFFANSTSRKALEHARETAVKEGRAWVDVVINLHPHASFTWVDDQCSVPFQLAAKNYGNSPATDVFVTAVVVPERADVERQRAEIIAMVDNVAIFPDTVFPGEKSPAQNWSMVFSPSERMRQHQMGTMTVLAYAIYSSASGDQRYITLRAFDLRHGSGAILQSDCPIPTSDLYFGGSVADRGYVT